MPQPHSNGEEAVRALRGFATGNLCNAHPEVRAMTSVLRPLFPGARLAGPAKTARITLGQNAAIHRALHGARPGAVLVVDAGGEEEIKARLARGETTLEIFGIPLEP